MHEWVKTTLSFVLAVYRGMLLRLQVPKKFTYSAQNRLNDIPLYYGYYCGLFNKYGLYYRDSGDHLIAPHTCSSGIKHLLYVNTI